MTLHRSFTKLRSTFTMKMRRRRLKSNRKIWIPLDGLFLSAEGKRSISPASSTTSLSTARLLVSSALPTSNGLGSGSATLNVSVMVKDEAGESISELFSGGGVINMEVFAVSGFLGETIPVFGLAGRY